MNKAFKYRMYPNKNQISLLEKTFGCVRFVWNNILAWRSEEYRVNKTKINYSKTSAYLTAFKTEKVFLADVSSVALQQTLRNQDLAFSNFFAKRGAYPNFKKKHGKQSFRLVSSGFSLKDGKLYIAKSKEPLKIKWSRLLQGEPTSITISKDCAGRYFVSILCTTEIQHKPVLSKSVGIDVGISHFAITSDGEKFANQKLIKKHEQKLAKLQRRLSKKKKGSKNRLKAKLKVAKLHAKIADTRKDYLHKTSTKLINENQVICLEDLNVSGMVKNRKLAKAISDCGWTDFNNMLAYKAEWYGRTISKISSWYPSSQICSTCGYQPGKKPLNIRKWICTNCGVKHDRDINAAKNILTAGQAELACGEAVRPKRGNSLVEARIPRL